MKNKYENKYEEALYNIGNCYVKSEGKDLMFTDLYGGDWDILQDCVKENTKLKKENNKLNQDEKKALIKKVLRILNKYDLTDDYSYECQEAREEIKRLGDVDDNE